MVAINWPNGPVCPECGTERPSFLSSRRIWKCRACKKQFSAKAGTIFEDSPIPLEKWLPCVWLIANAHNGITSYEVAQALGVTQKTAWFMLHRIRLAMQTKTPGKIGGEIEVDETYIGGAARFMHKDKKQRVITSRGPQGKVAVLGLLERHGADKHSTIRLNVPKTTRKPHVQPIVRENVEAVATIYTDELVSYDGLAADYVHSVIHHSEVYVRGKIHTNGLENFWSFLKRAIKGTYVSVEPFHLFRYFDEQARRFNERRTNDVSRFLSVMGDTIGCRLTYKALTGAGLPQTC
jgi:transposase-like protein